MCLNSSHEEEEKERKKKREKKGIREEGGKGGGVAYLGEEGDNCYALGQGMLLSFF